MPFKKGPSALEAPSHPHEFPRIAKEMGFSFSLRRGRVDWHKIDSINIDRLVQDRDLLTLQDNLLNVINYNLDSEYDVKILDQNFVKLFKLAQLSIDYLMYSEQHLYNCIELLHENNIQLSRDLKSKEEETEKLDDCIKSLQKKMKEKSHDLNHKVTVVGEQSRCGHCGKTFLNASYLSAHHYRRHPTSPTLTADEPTDALKTEVARLAAEIRRLKEGMPSSLDSGVASQHRAREANSQPTADKRRENFEQYVQEQLASMRNMMVGEFKKLQNWHAEGIHHKAQQFHLPDQIPLKDHLTEKTASELESMQDQMETFSGMLNRLQKKSEKEIEDMRARLNVNENTKQSSTASESVLQELLEHKAKQDEIMSFQAQQILKLTHQKMKTNVEPTSPVPSPRMGHRSTQKKSSSTSAPITVHRHFESQSDKSFAVPQQSTVKLADPEKRQTASSKSSMVQLLPPHNLPSDVLQKSDGSDQQSDNRLSLANAERSPTVAILNARKEDVEIVDISSSESSASSESTISNDVEQGNIEYFSGRQSPVMNDKTATISKLRDSENKYPIEVTASISRESGKGDVVVNRQFETIASKSKESGKGDIVVNRQEIGTASKSRESGKGDLGVSRQLETASILKDSGKGDLVVIREVETTASNSREREKPRMGEDRPSGREIPARLESLLRRTGTRVMFDTAQQPTKGPSRDTLATSQKVGENLYSEITKREDGVTRSVEKREEDSDEESEVTNTEDSTGQSSVDLALHSAESLASAVAKNPEVLAELKVGIQQQFRRRLDELGVDPEWRGIPVATFNRHMDTVKHHANITAKRYGSYFQIRADLVADVEQQLLRLNRGAGSGEIGATHSNRRTPTFAPVRSRRSRPVKGDVMNVKHRPVRHGKPAKAVFRLQAAWTADKIKSHAPKKQETKEVISPTKNNTPPQIPRKMQAFTSTPVKSNKFFEETSNDLHSSAENEYSEDDYELSSENMSGIENAQDSALLQQASTVIKSPRNILSKSDNFLDASPKQFNEVSSRSVLKGAVSTGSLITKKRVLFVDQDDSLPAESTKKDIPSEIRVDTRQSSRTIGLLGEGYDSDFDISSGPSTDDDVKNKKKVQQQ